MGEKITIPKTATLEEARQIFNDGVSFVYNNPCAGCGKECSTPTMKIWRDRIIKFGGVEQMYTQYFCRGCRPKKGEAPVQKEPVATTAPPRAEKPVVPRAAPTATSAPPAQHAPQPQPVDRSVPAVRVEPIRGSRRPGEAINVPPGMAFGFSVYEGGVHKSTHWYDLHGNPQFA